MIKLFFTKRVAMAVTRHFVGAIGATMMTAGYIDAETVDQLTGAGMVIASVGWSIWEKRF